MSKQRARFDRYLLWCSVGDGEPFWMIHAEPLVYVLATEGDAILVEDIVGWFRDAAPSWPAPAPTDDDIVTLAEAVNVLRVTAPSETDQDDPRRQRIERVKSAITDLQADLPDMIRGARLRLERRDEPHLSPAQIEGLEALLTAAQGARSAFRWLPTKRRQSDWHEPAKLVAWHARRIWRRLGKGNVGIGSKPTSPLVRLLEAALPRIGEELPTAEAIAQMLARAERRPRKPVPLPSLAPTRWMFKTTAP